MPHPLSSSYAKIFGETNFRTWEIPRSGSKAEDGGKKERKKEERKIGFNVFTKFVGDNKEIHQKQIFVIITNMDMNDISIIYFDTPFRG